ncbi:hypothetical protein NQZ68_034424 [Dissostichus eleginoides]|nr:hypothetical protein NQZ68_034424 [Dissostichus eleginoides]
MSWIPSINHRPPSSGDKTNNSQPNIQPRKDELLSGLHSHSLHSGHWDESGMEALMGDPRIPWVIYIPPIPSTPPASAATHSKTIRPINASQPVTWLAARSTAEFLPAVNAVNHITCLQIL